MFFSSKINILLVASATIPTRTAAQLLSGGVITQTPDWPELYDPDTILNLNVKIKSTDLNTINGDGSFDVEVPALFWEDADGEETAQLVSIRRKSASSIGGKLSYKIDINEYEGDINDVLGLAKKKWHGIKKLSLENGDNRNVVTEQLAWFMNMAAYNSSYPERHLPGMANFANLRAHVVSGGVSGSFDFDGVASVQNLGVYVNVEQVDKTFLKNRDVWESDQTYLYKQSGIPYAEPKESGCEDDIAKIDSPTKKEIVCSPLSLKPNGNSEEDECTFDELQNNLDMEVFLAQASIEMFISSPDDMFAKGKNFYFVDYSDEICTSKLANSKRSFYQWDLDTAFFDITSNVYMSNIGKGKDRGQSEIQRVILGHQVYLDMFNDKLAFLLDDSPGSIVDRALAHLTNMQYSLTPFLDSDANSKNAASDLIQMKIWLQERQDIVAGQICWGGGGLGPCETTTTTTTAGTTTGATTTVIPVTTTAATTTTTTTTVDPVTTTEATTTVIPVTTTAATTSTTTTTVDPVTTTATTTSRTATTSGPATSTSTATTTVATTATTTTEAITTTTTAACVPRRGNCEGNIICCGGLGCIKKGKRFTCRRN